MAGRAGLDRHEDSWPRQMLSSAQAQDASVNSGSRADLKSMASTGRGLARPVLIGWPQ